MKNRPQNLEPLDRWLAQSAWRKHARLNSTPDALVDADSWAALKTALAEEPADLVEIMAQALPVRHATWWGLLCGAAVEGFALGGPAADCVRAVIDWVFQTEEVQRLKARAVAEPTDWKLAEGLLARAVAWSSGSILPDSVPAFVPAPAGVTGQMVAAAVFSFAARNNLHDHSELLWHFLGLGEGVASGLLLPEGWEIQWLSLGESVMVSPLDLPVIEIPGDLGYGF